MCVVRAGDVIKDNDPRRPDKYVEVMSIRQIGKKVFAVYEAGQRPARINVDHIYNDGKARRSGWTLVSHCDTEGVAAQ